MSAVARNYGYRVIIDKDKKKPEPTISLAQLKARCEDAAKYLPKKKW